MKSLIDLKDVEPMSSEASRALIICTSNESKGLEIGPKLEGQPIYRIMRKRRELGKIPVSDWVLAFLMTQCVNPAQGVMYAHACVEIYRKYRKEVTMNELCEEFGDGFPTEQATKDFWYSMKVEREPGVICSDNLLDTREPWVL